MAKKLTVLYLFESPVPEKYDASTLGFGELRVIASIPEVGKVIALGKRGKSFYHTDTKVNSQSDTEKKVIIDRYAWPNNLLAYYLSWLPLLWYGWQICKKRNVSVIHAESPHISGIAAIILGKIFHFKTIVEYKVSYDAVAIFRYGKYLGVFLNWTFWLVAIPVMKTTDYVAANSNTYKNYLQNKLHIQKIGFYNPAVVIPIDFSTKKHMGINAGFIGRLYPDKGVIYLIRMIISYQDWFRKNNVKFKIAGNGPELNRVKSTVLENHIDDIVSLLGTQNRWEFFKNIDVYINTTIVKPALEMTIVEAGMVGLPTIAFGESGYPETVKNKFSGFIVPMGNTDALFHYIKELSLDEKLLRHLGSNAIEYSRKYSLKNQIANLGRIYSDLFNL